jgi:hypothetical protein
VLDRVGDVACTCFGADGVDKCVLHFGQLLFSYIYMARTTPRLCESTLRFEKCSDLNGVGSEQSECRDGT